MLEAIRRYVMNVLRALDILINVLVGGKVRTISARLGEKKMRGTMNFVDRLIDSALERVDPGHSLDAYEAWRTFTDRDGTVYELKRVE